MNDSDHKYLSVISELWSETAEKSIVKVSGISMQPILLDGESIIVDHRVKDLRSGDIGVFDKDGVMIVHRVLFKKEIGQEITYRTKGDWMFYMDPPIEARNVIGKVASLSRKGKKYDLNLAGSVFYSRIMVLYSLFIAIDGKVAYLLDRGIHGMAHLIFRRKGTGGTLFFRRLFYGIDRFLQKIFHGLFFRIFHRNDPRENAF
jgi:signal peptidase I